MNAVRARELERESLWARDFGQRISVEKRASKMVIELHFLSPAS